MLRDPSFVRTTFVTLIYFAIGVLFLHLELAEYGWIVFVMFPLTLGAVIGAMPVFRWAIIGFFLATVVFLILLFFSAVEGMVCILMALPIIIPLVLLGIALNQALIEIGFVKPRSDLKSLTMPLLVLVIMTQAENYLLDDGPSVIEVRTERYYPFPAGIVYDAIKSVDTLVAEKPFLMRLDLPVPHKCILEREEIGGLRTCYFEGGLITERITELERGVILRMDVVDYQLTGRKWLGFREAVYLFDSVEGGCRLTRITSYTSALRPRFYWQPLEEMGIQQEHKFVLDNLNNDLNELHHPLISQEEYSEGQLSRLVRDYYNNSLKEVVSFFSESKKLNEAELDEVMKMLEELKKNYDTSKEEYAAVRENIPMSISIAED